MNANLNLKNKFKNWVVCSWVQNILENDLMILDGIERGKVSGGKRVSTTSM